MGDVSPLQQTYARGIKRSGSRDELPAGAVWDLVDYIPEILGSPLRKRGGFSYGSNAFGAGSYAAACAIPDFTTGARGVGISDAGNLYSVNLSTGATTSEGAAVVPISIPQLHRDVLIIPSPDGATGVKRYVAAGGAPAALSATAPAGMHAAVYKDRSILASIDGDLQRVFFGPDGDPTGVWDTSESWIDASFPVSGGVAAMRNVIILFGAGRCERIRGNTPPPNTDMLLEPLFDTGCIDARTIVPSGDNVIFANQEGIWLTDGAVLENLAESAGMLSYWIDILSSYDASTWTLAAGLDRGLYVISIMDGGTFVDAIALDTDARNWFRLSNLTASMFARSLGTNEELYFSLRDEPRLGRLSTIFEPADGVRDDADGVAILPTLETGFYADKDEQKRWHNVYLSYALEAPSTAAELQLSYVTSPDETVYTDLASTFGEQGDVDRQRLPLRFRGRGVAFKLTQTAASADTRIHTIGAEVHALEGSR